MANQHDIEQLRAVVERVFGRQTTEEVDLHAALARCQPSPEYLELTRQTSQIFKDIFAAKNAWPADCPPQTEDHNVNTLIRNCRVAPDTGCWEWRGATSKKGYGRVKIGGKLYLPHRVMAVYAGILEDAADTTGRRVCVLHECDNPRCCNPQHLKVGTMSQNMKDCVARGRHKRPISSKG
jgi:hypothetical protein